MNTIDFIRETAIFMANDRPDIYDIETAVEEISTAIDCLREAGDSPFETISFTSYMFSRVYDEGTEGFIFSKKVSRLWIDVEGEEVQAIAYEPDLELPFIGDIDVDDDDDM